jgi:hypothetical protein
LTEDGSIESFIYIPGRAGFRINADGFAEFCNVVARGRIEAEEGFFRGRVEADSGTFKEGFFTDITVEGNSSFRGVSIEAGPLQVKPAGVTFSLSYNRGANISTILSDISARTGQGYPLGISVINGTYNSKNIVSITGGQSISYGPSGYPIINYYMIITFDDNSLAMPVGTITSAMSFSFEFGDLVFKLTGIQVSDPKIAGVVWRDGTTLKISNG